MISRILVHKKLRRLQALDENGHEAFRFPIALGRCPEGNKERQGDGKTPEGRYRVCLKNPQGKFGPSLGIDYPSPDDALRLGAEEKLLELIRLAHREGRRPPWGSPLGGEICIHGGGTASDWTAGCVALENRDMEALFPLVALGTPVEILP